MFEVVYTVDDYYDGPRSGIADCYGAPHRFESEWRDGEDLDTNTFLLMPIENADFELALEDWAIWKRWNSVYRAGKTDLDSHRALPEDRQRHQEIERLLTGRFEIDSRRAVRKTGIFRSREGLQSIGWGEVQWDDP